MQINIKLLKAAATMVAKDDTRYYLQGVAVQGVLNKGVFIVATDGHRLIAFRQSPELPFDVNPFGIIIPAAIIDGIKLHKTEEFGELTHVEGMKWSISYINAPTITFDVVDGTFPDWRRVVPKETNGEAAQYNPLLLASFCKAKKTLGAKSPDVVAVSHNGPGPALVSLGETVDGFGVIMPFRPQFTVNKETPAWAQ